MKSVRVVGIIYNPRATKALSMAEEIFQMIGPGRQCWMGSADDEITNPHLDETDLIITVGGDAIFNVVPFAGLGVGVGIALLGLWLLISGKHMGIWAAPRVRGSDRRNVKGLFLFGMLYAISSLGCAFPVFLAAVGILAGQNLGDLDLRSSLLRFTSYGLGMGMVLTGITLGVVFFRETVSQILRRVFPYLGVAGNLALMGAGSYLVWYWTLGDGGELLTFRLEKLF